MSEHHGSVVVHAPIQQVYDFFTHFNDFPKFMSFIKEVTYYDEQRSHWVAELTGTHEWDAANQNWIAGQQVGWRSTNGLENTGLVKFSALGDQRTQVNVFISYKLPAGPVGEFVDRLGIDSRFDQELQRDLEHFARMVEQAPANALDPMQSHYLFHSDSTVQQGKATQPQIASMQRDPMMSQEALNQRAETVQREEAQNQEIEQNREALRQQQRNMEREVAQEQQAALRKQAEIDRHNAQDQPVPAVEERALDPVHDTIGGRNASMVRTAIGDQDARSERYPNYHQDSMMSRKPGKRTGTGQTSVEHIEQESPWHASIQGRPMDGQLEEEPSITDQEPLKRQESNDQRAE